MPAHKVQGMIRGLVLLTSFSLAATAQVICALGTDAAAYKSSADQRPSPDALELAARTTKASATVCGSNCPQAVLFRNATAPNLMLTVDSGRAKVVYAPKMFTAAYDRHGDAGIMALIAHALGHALDDAIGAAWVEKSWNAEVRADGWAGCILARSGLSAVEWQAAQAALSEYPAPSHPAWNLRLAAIRSGYLHCGGK
jgi:hypothetical protein